MKPLNEWTAEELRRTLIYDTDLETEAIEIVLAELLRRERVAMRAKCLDAIRKAQEPRQELYRLYGHRDDLQRCGGMTDAIEAIEGMQS